MMENEKGKLLENSIAEMSNRSLVKRAWSRWRQMGLIQKTGTRESNLWIWKNKIQPGSRSFAFSFVFSLKKIKNETFWSSSRISASTSMINRRQWLNEWFCGIQMWYSHLVLLLCQDVDEAFIDSNSPRLQSQQACLLWFDAFTKHWINVCRPLAQFMQTDVSHFGQLEYGWCSNAYISTLVSPPDADAMRLPMLILVCEIRGHVLRMLTLNTPPASSKPKFIFIYLYISLNLDRLRESD